jgi:TonB family protein
MSSLPQPDSSLFLANLRTATSGANGETRNLLETATEAARILTGATGVALALRRDGRVTCMARSGEIAPDVGAPVSESSGISGECLRTGRTLLCRDTLNDGRVDSEVCLRLGLRSIALVPVRSRAEIVGILEAFSSRPEAFSDEHLSVLGRIAEMLESQAKSPPAAPPVAKAAMPPLTKSAPLPPSAKIAATRMTERFERPPVETEQLRAEPLHRPSPLFLWTRRYWPVAGCSALVFTVAAAWSMWHSSASQKAEAQVPPAVTAEAATPAIANGSWNVDQAGSGSAEGRTANRTIKPAAGISLERVSSTRGAPSKAEAAQAEEPRVADVVTVVAKDPAKPKQETLVAEEDVQAPSLTLSGANEPALGGVVSADVRKPALEVRTSQGVTPLVLEHRVEPVYPPDASQYGIQGSVSLRAIVGEDGVVREVTVIKGSPVLARAAVEAVKKWRYRPLLLNGKPTASEADVVVNFKAQ